MFLRELKAPLSDIKGCGKEIANKLFKLGLVNAADILLFSPRRYEDRTQIRLLNEFSKGPVQCAVVVKDHAWIGFGKKQTLKIIIEDINGTKASLVCFNRSFLANSLSIGSRIKIYGVFEYKYSELQCSTFEATKQSYEDEIVKADGVMPIYHLTDGLGQTRIRSIVRQAIERWGIIDNEIPQSIIKKRGLLNKSMAIKMLHNPTTMQDAELANYTLAYEELFYLQIMIARRIAARKKTNIHVNANIAASNKKAAYDSLIALRSKLPFKLSIDQDKVINEIIEDMHSPQVMARLLQGDVGAGKTLVAFFAVLYSIKLGSASNSQAALLAPTELLARQHAEIAAKLLEPLGLRLAFLSGNVSDSARKPLLNALANGDIDFVIGTHALFSKDVVYKNLKLVIIDEQQRFGVLQRIAMSEKGINVNTLMMSATPIPRTLLLSAFGDLSVSIIKSSPQGRLPIITHLAKTETRVYDFVRREMKLGHKAYFVYPLVEHSEKLELKNAQNMFEHLSKNIFPDFKGGLIHARLKEEEKQAVMFDFANGDTSFLVATSILEVGVDVPLATCMVIEHAERFGLASLHQLRGRVGRSNLQSYCFLIWSDNISDEAKDRLMVMKEHNDGFVIAEKDLLIRGPGEITGTNQAGAINLRFAKLHNSSLLEAAKEDAFELIKNDEALLGIDGLVVKSVLERASPFDESSAANG